MTMANNDFRNPRYFGFWAQKSPHILLYPPSSLCRNLFLYFFGFRLIGLVFWFNRGKNSLGGVFGFPVSTTSGVFFRLNVVSNCVPSGCGYNKARKFYSPIIENL